MIELLELQQLDIRIADLKQREHELPKQKDKYKIHRERLAAELKSSEERCKKLLLEQRECQGEIEQRQAQIRKYDEQLYAVKKNEEYKALLYEMDLLKKQIAVKEERIIALMCEYDEAREGFAADKERIEAELRDIEGECARIDGDLATLTAERKALVKSRPPIAAKVAPDMLKRYERIRKVKMPAAVPMNNDACGGCFMTIRPQIVNEIMGNEKTHACQHCGRLLYWPGNLPGAHTADMAESA